MFPLIILRLPVKCEWPNSILIMETQLKVHLVTILELLNGCLAHERVLVSIQEGDTKPRLRGSLRSVWFPSPEKLEDSIRKASGIKFVPNQICRSVRYGDLLGNKEAVENVFFYQRF